MKRILQIAGIVAVVLLIAVLALPFLVNANTFRPALEARLSAILGRQVTIGDLSLSLLAGGIQATDLAIADDPAFGTNPFLKANSLGAGIDLVALIFSRRLDVRNITIDRPDITLLQDQAGTWNFASLGKTSEPPAQASDAPPEPASQPLALSIDLIRISDGRLSIGSTTGSKETEPPHKFEKVNIELRDFSATSAFPFTMDATVVGGGEVHLDGKAGPIPPAQAVQTPFDANLKIDGLDLAGSGFARPASGIAGILGAQLSAKSDGSRVGINGAARLNQLRLTKNGKASQEPVSTDLTLTHDLGTQRGTIDRMPIRIGSAQSVLTGTYDLSGPQPVLNAKLTGDSLQLTELAGILPALDVVLPAGASIERGVAALNVTSRGPMSNLVTTGTFSLNDVLLANYSLTEKLKVIGALSGISAEPKSTLELFSAKFENSAAGTAVQDAKLILPAIGQLTGSGTISPKHELDLHMQATVRAKSALAALGQSGDTITVPLQIQGTSENPVFRADVKGAATQKLKQFTRDPSSAVDAAKGIINLFKKKDNGK